MTKYIDFALVGELVVHGDVHYEDLKRLPAADVEEVRHGRWEHDFIFYVCSLCGKHISDSTLDDNSEPVYCPNCGAKMVNEDE